MAREIQDELVLIQVDTGTYYTLNEVGGRVWVLCDGTNTVRQIAAILSLEFDAEQEVIEGDVVELVAELADEQLLICTT